MKQLFAIILFLMVSNLLHAQVFITTPYFPTLNSDITITFDASKGNGALNGATGPIYAHTGVITSTSTSGTDWKYVKGNWGTADPTVLMTSIGNNKYTISYNIKNFYGVPNGEAVFKLAFVFRNQAGSVVGRATDGGDIFYDVAQSLTALDTRIFTPDVNNFLLASGQSIYFFGASSLAADLQLLDNGVQVHTVSGATTMNHVYQPSTGGSHTLKFIATGGGATDTSTLLFTMPNASVVENPPLGTQLGANYLSNSSVRLMLEAPNKTNVFVIGSFTNWAISTDYQMKKSVDGSKWWIDLTGLTPGQNVLYQYVVDGTIKIADPLSETVLDPFDDSFISSTVYPNMPPYPQGKTTGHISVITPGKTPYAWVNTTFVRPEKTDLIVYELLLRDFLGAHDYKTLLDTLNYIDRMGVNVIELMPVSEFEGNISWGYGVSFHMALDKYYGPIDRLKAFIDAAHSKGIAVVLDVVYNHCFGQSPLTDLYWDDANDRPAADNPWLNPIAKHPFNVGYDMNHESQATKDYTTRTLKYWLTEFKVDGFRFDLSKGLTQTNSGGNVGQWGQFDQSRINILKYYADRVWETTPGAYMIMEHFADNSEETVLANYGMMLWGNSNAAYNEGSMGYGSNGTAGVSHKSRNWTVPHLVGYMESHDEERLMYKNLTFGNLNANYSVKDLNTALKRQELVSAFFYTVPGPKMLWQFGELGYDFSIFQCPNGTVPTPYGADQCKTDPKPIRWDYLQQPGRRHLLGVTQALMHLKTNYEVFRTGDYNVSELGSSPKKAFHLTSADMKVTILGNFNIVAQDINPVFQQTGWWYEYFTGDSIQVSNVSANITLAPGEYRLYTSSRIQLPTNSILTSTQQPSLFVGECTLYPNPADNQCFVEFSLAKSADVSMELTDLSGRMVRSQHLGQLAANSLYTESVDVASLPKGLYFLVIKADHQRLVKKLVH